jgi:hypothetical protein
LAAKLNGETMLGLLTLALRTDKSSYLVGEKPVYTLQNAQPGSVVKWTSFKDGQPTGEYEENYGGIIGNIGGAELTGGPWTEAQAGRWQKIAVVFAPDGSRSTAEVFFNVQPTASAVTTTPQPAASSWLSGNFSFDLFGNAVSINRGAGLAIGAVGLWAIWNSSGKRK